MMRNILKSPGWFILTDKLDLDPNESSSFKLRLYNGPKEINDLKQAGHNLSAAVDYGWFTFLAKPLLVVLRWFYSFTHNYGDCDHSANNHHQDNFLASDPEKLHIHAKNEKDSAQDSANPGKIQG